MTRNILLLGIVSLCLCTGAWAQSAGSTTVKEPLATIAGQPVYEEELLPQMEGQLRQLRNQEYEIKSKTLESVVNRRALEAAAKKAGVAPETLLSQEADSKVVEPTDAEMQAFYQQVKDRVNQPYDEVKTQIRDLLKQNSMQQARDTYYQRLRQEFKVAILLSPPKMDVGYDSTRVRGDAKAQVTIVEFSDFQCPFCLRVYPTLRDLLAKYDGRVKLAYRDFPLREGHPLAEGAAEAGRCANEQGKFWEYHDIIFANPNKLDRAALLDHARALKLDDKRFEACLSSGKFKGAIDNDLQAGIKAGVNGTPAFFINGVFLNGAQPAAAFEKAIDTELARLDRQHQAMTSTPAGK